MGPEAIKLKTDSQLVVSQIRGEAHAKDLLLQQYLKLDTKKLATFKPLKFLTLREKRILTPMFHLSWSSLGARGSTNPSSRRPKKHQAYNFMEDDDNCL